MSDNVYDLDRERKEKELKELSNNETPSNLSHWPTSVIDSAINSLK